MTSLKDAFKGANIGKSNVGLQEVSLDMSLLPPGFIRRGFPPNPSTHKLHDFRDPKQPGLNICIHEAHAETVNMRREADGTVTNMGSTYGKVRCSNPSSSTSPNGFYCEEHQRLVKKRELPRDSPYRWNPADRGQHELITYIVGVEGRALEDALIEGRTNSVRLTVKGDHIIYIEPEDTVF